MKKKFFFCILTTLLLVFFFQIDVSSQIKDIEYYTSQAPFKMPFFTVPNFPNKTFYLDSFGGVNDGKTFNTVAFAKAITACNQSGGGIVDVGAGKWLTGPIELKSNVNLHLEKGAVIQFTKDHTMYPIIKTGKGSTSYAPASPIYGFDLTNIAITGDGIIDGAGDSWRPVKKSKVDKDTWDEMKDAGVLSLDGKVWWPNREAMQGEDYLKKLKLKGNDITADDYLPAREYLRPYMLYLINCINILIEGITLRNSPKFVFYPNHCSYLTMKYVNVYNDWWAQNGDGIDISACKNVVLYKCTVNAGDDGICMKSSGKNAEGDSANLENILIAECNVLRGHGGFVIGSNTDGGMNNIYVTNCTFIGTDIGIRVKSNVGRGGVVKNIYMKNISMKNIINDAISFDTYYEDVAVGKEKSDLSKTFRDKTPDFKNFYISNINCDGAAAAITIVGLPEMKIKRLYFDNINIFSKKGFECTNAEDLFLKKVKLNCNKPYFETNGCKNIHID